MSMTKVMPSSSQPPWSRVQTPGRLSSLSWRQPSNSVTLTAAMEYPMVTNSTTFERSLPPTRNSLPVQSTTPSNNAAPPVSGYLCIVQDPSGPGTWRAPSPAGVRWVLISPQSVMLRWVLSRTSNGSPNLLCQDAPHTAFIVDRFFLHRVAWNRTPCSSCSTRSSPAGTLTVIPLSALIRPSSQTLCPEWRARAGEWSQRSASKANTSPLSRLPLSTRATPTCRMPHRPSASRIQPQVAPAVGSSALLALCSRFRPLPCALPWRPGSLFRCRVPGDSEVTPLSAGGSPSLLLRPAQPSPAAEQGPSSPARLTLLPLGGAGASLASLRTRPAPVLPCRPPAASRAQWSNSRPPS